MASGIGVDQPVFWIVLVLLSRVPALRTSSRHRRSMTMRLIDRLATIGRAEEIRIPSPFVHSEGNRTVRIGIFTDIHANFPALEAVLGAFAAEQCDIVVHTGDAVGYGPHPGEVVERLLGLENAILLMGNHDEYAVQGPAHAHMAGMDPVERAHQAWVRSQLTEEHIAAMAEWPYLHQVQTSGAHLVACHYARLTDGSDFAPILRNAPPAAFDALFAPPEPAIVFYGHDHPAADIQGRSRFIDPGSAGVGSFPVARYAVVDLGDDSAPGVRFGSVRYDGDRVLRDLEARQMPGRSYVIATLRDNA